MSIVALKRKTQVLHNNMSAGQPSFSINGTTRSSGYVGQDMLGRTLVRSLSDKNGTLKGHGGCCGKYPTPQIKTSPEMASLNDNNVVKSSSLGNNGMLMKRHRWIRRPQPYTTWKPSGRANINNQSYYIEYVARKAMDGSCNVIAGSTTTTPLPAATIRCCNISTTNYAMASKKQPTITKPESFLSPMSQSMYIRNINKKCGAREDFYVKNDNKNVPFACGNAV
jgi:hypothetical protein